MEKTKEKLEEQFLWRSVWTFSFEAAIVLVEWITISMAIGIVRHFSWTSIFGSFASAISSQFSLASLGVALLLTMLVGLDVACTSFSYQVKRHAPKSRFETFVSVFSINKWIQLIVRSFIGSCLSCIFLSAFGVGRIVEQCENGSKFCFNLTQIGCISFGAVCGCISALRRSNVVSFPLIHLPLRRVAENEALPLLKKAFGRTVPAFLAFLPIFLWIGIRSWIVLAKVFDVSLMIESLWSLLSPSFCLPVFIAGFFVFKFHEMSFLLFQHFQTQHVILPVGSANLDLEPTVRLYYGLTLHTRPLFKYLAFHDLRFLAEYDVSRRKGLFILSNPGGNPHNWNAVFNVCLNEVKSFITEFDPNPQRKLEELTGKPGIEPGTVTPGILKPRNLASAYQTSPVKIMEVDKKEKATYLGLLEDKVQKFSKKIMETPTIAYLFGVNETAELQNAIYGSVPVRLSVHALGHLCSVAKDEDDFGIVQKDLATVVKTFLELQMVLEKQTRIPASDRKSLLTTVRTAIYRITNTYGKQILSLHLEEPCKNQMAAYLNLRVMG